MIKIDVEGTEYDVIRGAVRTLEREKPVMIVEVESRQTKGNTKPVFNLLNDLGYDAFILDRSTMLGMPTAGRRRRDRSPQRVRQVALGALHFSRKRLPLLHIGEVVKRIHDQNRDVNLSVIDYFVNNFIFLPRERGFSGYRVVGRLTEPRYPDPGWIAERIRLLPALDRFQLTPARSQRL